VKSAVHFEKLVSQVQWFADSLYSDRAIANYDSCSVELVKNSLKAFVEMEVLHRDEKGMMMLTREYAEDESKLLQLAEHIGVFRNPHSSRPFDIRTRVFDMQSLSKL
jgi:hypothetical protein